jgi:hypothetical protein
MNIVFPRRVGQASKYVPRIQLKPPASALDADNRLAYGLARS